VLFQGHWHTSFRAMPPLSHNEEKKPQSLEYGREFITAAIQTQALRSAGLLRNW
jgi:hypothetical protein